MKHFNQNFETRLWKTIAEIENDSLVEVVVVIKPRSADYRDSVLWWGVGAAFVIFTVMMFAPIVFGDYFLYSGPPVGFFGGMIAASVFPPLQRLLISPKRKQRSVEIMARALFQKGGIRHTNEKIGILIYCSVLEKIVSVVPDRGVETAIPPEEWASLTAGLHGIFKQRNPAEALLEHLKACQPVFNRYIPPVEHDINELPDNLDIDL